MEPLTHSMVIRADAHRRIGAGHLMRCFALAQEWQRSGGHAMFAGRCDSVALRSRIEAAGMEFTELQPVLSSTEDVRALLELLAAAAGRTRPLVVLDGYGFGPPYHHALRAAGYPLLVIDDTAHLEMYDADILLNQNVGAESLGYRVGEHTVMLLGPKHVLLRDEFRQWPSKRGHNGGRASFRVLVTMGASDPVNATGKVVGALASTDSRTLQCKVVIGPASVHLESVQSVMRGYPGVQLVSTPRSMPELMDWADLAITAGGSTCYELAFMGLPSLIVTIADNQKGIATGLDAVGTAVYLGHWDSVSNEEIAAGLETLRLAEERRRLMSIKGQRLVDGKGAARVVRAITQFLDESP